ncbi:MAG: phage holin family protein [Muribaculaceae bacterium]
MELGNYKELFAEIKKYVTLQVDYTKYTVAEKMVVLLSAMATAFVLGALGFGVLFYLSIALADYLAIMLNCYWGAHVIVACLYGLLLWGVVIMRKQLIVNPIARFLSKLFLKPNE